MARDKLPTINFAQIRTYDGTQSGGFEQLAVELFARAHGLSRQLVRVDGAGGDGGVEAYGTVEGKGKLGMQAKFFDQFADTQWRQIDKSVKTALSHHPDLREYCVYVPLDRTKGRPGKTKGQVEKWDGLVKAWSNLPNGARVDFIWQGRYEVELELKKSENHDLLFYWFGIPQFDEDWIDRLVAASIQTLGERYQPGRHVDVGVGRELDRFAWSPHFGHAIEAAYVNLAEKCLSFTQTLQQLQMPAEHQDHLAVVQKAIDEVVRTEYPVYGVKNVHQVLLPTRALQDRVDELASYHRKQQTRPGEKPNEKIEYQEHRIEDFAREVGRWIDLLGRCSIADHQCVLVRGDAGSGKSHLIAHCAVQARKSKQPALLVLGEQFLDGRAPLIQLCDQIGWNRGPDSLLRVLNVAASLAARPALLLIDALNESSERRLWKSHLHPIAAEVRKYPHVRLVVSCRSDFVGITMPNDFRARVPDGWGLIPHRGFGDVLAAAVARYFVTYNIRSAHFPPLLDEFRNPLFLDTFCRAFENQSLPNGPITLQTVMDRRIARLSEKIQRDIDCDEYHIRRAIHSFAEKIHENGGVPVEESVARAAIEPHSPSKESSRSLYTHLLSNGLLLRRIDRYGEDEPPVVVRFAFERFSDYFIARGVLNDISDATALSNLVQGGCRLDWLRAWDGYSENRGIARALAVLAPELCGIELADVLPHDIEHRGSVLADLMDSLPWRSSGSITESTETLLIEASRYGSTTSFIEALLRLSTITEHPFNARFLHGRLVAKSLQERDTVWTIPVTELVADTETVPSTLVEWAIQVPRNLVSDAQASLVASVLLWFGSSNSVAFRSRAGLAAIRILLGRPHVTRALIENFDTVNDPYVVERLYAVACGVAMREPPGKGLLELATTAHRLVFGKGEVPPHMLLRDYAQTLLETAAYRGCLDPTISPHSFRPPFVSKMPEIMGEAEAELVEKDEKWRRIASSVRPESMGMYGDFGRYVMGSAVHHFLRTTLKQPLPKKPYFSHVFDDKTARRWVLQRVKALGWTNDFFGEYDNSRHDYRSTDDEHKIERIGKKYQWIALHELLGYLSDHYHLSPDWVDEPRTYQGAWQISHRNFDPSAEPAPPPVQEDSDEPQAPLSPSPDGWSYATPYPDPFANLPLVADRAAWVKFRPNNPIQLFTTKRAEDSRQWLVLDGFWRWKEPRILRVRHGWDGRCEMWIHARSWLIHKDEKKGFLDRIRKLNFWGHGIGGVPLGEGWIGEYPYGASVAEARTICEQPDELTGEDKTLHVRTTCDWNGRGGAIVPSPQLCDALGLRWSGERAVFVDAKGLATTVDALLPNAGETPPCVVDAERLRAGLTRSGLEIVWAVVGQRHCWNGNKMVGDAETRFSGVYTLADNGIAGELTVVNVVALPIRE